MQSYVAEQDGWVLEPAGFCYCPEAQRGIHSVAFDAALAGIYRAPIERAPCLTLELDSECAHDRPAKPRAFETRYPNVNKPFNQLEM